jgi:hypothetical protein
MRYYVLRNRQSSKIERIYNLIQQHPIISKQIDYNIQFLSHLLFCYAIIRQLDKAQDILHRLIPLIQSVISSSKNRSSSSIGSSKQQEDQNVILQSCIHNIMVNTLKFMIHYRDQISLQNQNDNNTSQSTPTTTTAQQEFVNRAEQLFHLIRSFDAYDVKPFGMYI